MTVAFCGELQNATSITNHGALSNECFLDGLSFMPHIVFVLITLPILISWNKSYYGSMHVKSWVHFPGHELRFTLCILMVLLNLLEIGEGVISNSLYQGTHLHLFLPHCIALVGTVTSTIYYHYLEQWNSPRFLVLLIVYWAAVLATKALEISYQVQRGYGSDVMGFNLNCASVSICSSFLLIEAYVFFKLRYALFPKPKKIRPPPELEHTFFVHDYVNLLSKFSFSWVTRLLITGYKHPLERKELGSLPPCESAVKNFLILNRVILEEKKKSTARGKTFSLWWCYWRAFWRPLAVAGIAMFVGHMLAFVGPFCITKLIHFVEKTNAERIQQYGPLPEEEQYVDVVTYLNHGYILCLVLFLSTVAQNSALQMHHYIVIRQGIRLRSALQVVIYRKSLHLTTESKSLGLSANLISVDVYNAMMAFYMGHYSWILPLKALIFDKALHLACLTKTGGAASTGTMINHISVDSRNIMVFVYTMCFAVGMPIQVGIAVFLLYQQLGSSALIACAALLAMCPLQYFLSKFFAVMQKKTMACSDERLRLISELFSAIKLIKLCAWEKLLCGRVEVIRAKQIKLLFKGSCLAALTGFVTHGTPMFITLLAFVLFPYLQNEPLTAARAFTAIALFDILKTPLNLFPLMINMMVNAYISTQRIQKFLSSPEVDRCTPLPQEAKELKVELSLKSAEPEVKILNGTHSRSINPRTGEKEPGFPSYSKPRKRSSASCSECDEREKMLTVNEEPTRPKSVGNLLSLGAEKKLADKQHKDEFVHSDVDVRPRAMTSVTFASRRPHPSDGCISEEEPENLVEIENGSFSWDWETKEVHMESVNLSIKRGDMAMIIGTVGSGKSSLISAMLGEMCCASGSLVWTWNVKKAYAGQTPWLRNDSLQNNILFGLPMDKKLYRRVIHACALNPDISILPAGDQTEIGEKGINLSGGQKQRIALARALYTKADVVILDDPFSALDAHVGAHIFESGIVKMLMRRKCTVIMATNNLQYLSYAHSIVTVSDNKVSQVDNIEQLKVCHPDLYDIHRMSINKISSDEGNEDEGDLEADIDKERRLVQHDISSREFQRRMSTSQLDIDVASSRRDSITSTSPRQVYVGHFENFSHDEIHTLPDQMEERRVSHIEIETIPSSENVTPEEHEKGVGDKGSEAGRLIEEEERKEGAVSCSIYWAYIKACSLILSPVVILLYLGHTGANLGTDFWLSAWSSSASKTTNVSSNNTETGVDDELLDYYLKGYIALGVATVVLALFVAFACELAGLLASVRFHRKMLQTVLYAPMRFFDTTPIGRILNRFAGDTFIIDAKLASTISGLFRTTLLCASAMLVNAVAAPYFLLVAIPIILTYLFLQKFYRASSRELARLDSISKSPIVSHFTETLGGLSTIRAFGEAERFQMMVLKLIDSNATIFLWLNTCNRWLGVRLDHLGAAVVFSAAVCTVTMASHGFIGSGMVGLGIAYALMMAHYLNWVIRMLTDAEMQMNAVERVVHYTELTVEKPSEGQRTVSKVWPHEGQIVYNNVALSYAANLEPAVRNINLHIKPGKKVGICGRTGSGKSSLTLGLFRLNDIVEGCIMVDGVDISQVPLETLRSRLSIIPQDPVLFTGTIRFNLDPEGERTDADIWRALEIGQLKSTIEQLEGHLGALVQEGGMNFSVGQRQLFCLARAFLRDSRVLVMDEATASVDMGTDRQVQDVIHESFGERTVLTIAHRVSTITDYDEIVVLDGGRIVEHDSPQNLMANQSSRFYALVKSNK